MAEIMEKAYQIKITIYSPRETDPRVVFITDTLYSSYDKAKEACSVLAQSLSPIFIIIARQDKYKAVEDFKPEQQEVLNNSLYLNNTARQVFCKGNLIRAYLTPWDLQYEILELPIE